MNVEITNIEGFVNLMNCATSADIFENAKKAAAVASKDVIIAYPADRSGCGNIRIINPMNYLNSTGIHPTIVSNVIVHQNENILPRVKTLWFQRPFGIEHGKDFMINREIYRNKNVKLVIEHDDMLFGKNEKYLSVRKQQV